MFTWFYRRQKRKKTAQNIYGSIVAQARLPVFYTDLAVPDTLEGRFELLVIHVFLALERLRGTGEEGDGLMKELVDIFTADMDATMRELGIGDVKVAKKIRVLADVLRDRLLAYRAAADGAGVSDLSPMLGQHVYGAGPGHDVHAKTLASYMVKSYDHMKRLPLDGIPEGGIEFAPLATE